MNKSIISDCIKLCVITVIAGFLLGLVYNVTKAPIAAQEEKTKQNAYKAVFADAAEFKEMDFDEAGANKVLSDSGLGQNTITEIMLSLIHI